MQSVPEKANIDDSESQFDFLNVTDNSPVRAPVDRVRQNNARRAMRESIPNSMKESKSRKPFPVIRRPVSVAQTGALRPPRPGEPVEPPPPLTDGVRETVPFANTPNRANPDLDDLDFDLDNNEEWPGSDQWVDELHRVQPVNYRNSKPSVLRTLGYLLAGLLIVSGTLAALYSQPSVRAWAEPIVADAMGTLENTVVRIKAAASAGHDSPALAGNTMPEAAPAAIDAPLAPSVDSGLSTVEQPGATTQTEIALPAPVQSNAPPSLNTQFREVLAQLEVLLEQGNLVEAETILQTMDRAVYGYGAPEFTVIKERIDAGLLSESAEQAAAEDAQRAEQERAEQEARALEEEQRLAAEREQEAEQAAAEATRLAAQRAEQERQAAADLQLRTDRLAQEQARQEQLEIARQERIQLEQQQSSRAGQGAADAGTQRESIEQIAERQRELARQQRLIDAREVADEEIATNSSTQGDSGFDVALTGPSSPQQPAGQVQQPLPEPITDADLQLVYGQFALLESAIESRDVNAVIQLTERSGVRIQQMMQMFENNVSIQAQLRNVSTLDATGEIQGTLQITRLVRADGSVTGPPLDLSSVRLSSTRDGDGWSSIRW
ncbi:MAG: hypothetical protein AB8B64_18865 [Granulosicoccus sp.]